MPHLTRRPKAQRVGVPDVTWRAALVRYVLTAVVGGIAAGVLVALTVLVNLLLPMRP